MLLSRALQLMAPPTPSPATGWEQPPSGLAADVYLFFWERSARSFRRVPCERASTRGFVCCSEKIPTGLGESCNSLIVFAPGRGGQGWIVAEDTTRGVSGARRAIVQLTRAQWLCFSVVFLVACRNRRAPPPSCVQPTTRLFGGRNPLAASLLWGLVAKPQNGLRERTKLSRCFYTRLTLFVNIYAA